MLLQAENSGFFLFRLITANAFEHAQPVMEGVGEDVNIGLMPWDKFPIEPYFF